MSAYGTKGLFHGWNNVPGQSLALSGGGNIPLTDIGAAGGRIYPYPSGLRDLDLNEPLEVLDFLRQHLMPIGKTVSVSLGLGLSPVEVGASACDTLLETALCFDEHEVDDEGNPRVNEIIVVGETNSRPVAKCRSVDACAPPGSCAVTAAAGNIDDGSFDPDGDMLQLRQTPPGPYPIGQTGVVLVATDPHGASATCSAEVTARDCEAPEISCPQHSVVECQEHRGAVFDPPAATATDRCSTVTVPDPPPGVFDLGTTVVTYTATDGAGNQASCDTAVTVQDSSAPAITCPERQVVECSGNGHAAVAFAATATDACWGDLSTLCAPPSGASLPLGDTVVTCHTEDGSGNANDCSVTMTVKDTVPPTITSVMATPAVLWPPNHKMRRVEVDVQAVDICDPTLTCAVVSVASSEPDSGLGNGDLPNDSEIVGPTTVLLRAERKRMGNGRTYTITVECRDDTGGNATRAATTVTVPHDQKNG